MTKKKGQARLASDAFGGARASLEDLVRRLSGEEAPETHGDLEVTIRRETGELARQLLQARLDVLFERERADLAAAPPEVGNEVRVRDRHLESEFGRVVVRRHGLKTPGEKKRLGSR